MDVPLVGCTKCGRIFDNLTVKSVCLHQIFACLGHLKVKLQFLVPILEDTPFTLTFLEYFSDTIIALVSPLNVLFRFVLKNFVKYLRITIYYLLSP